MVDKQNAEFELEIEVCQPARHFRVFFLMYFRTFAIMTYNDLAKIRRIVPTGARGLVLQVAALS